MVDNTNNELEQKIEFNPVSHVNDRLSKMAAERSKIEGEWLLCEAQVDAPVSVDNDNKVLYNTQIDQSLCEQYSGRVNNQLYRDVAPEEEADAQEIFASKSILNYFLEKENRYRQLHMRDHKKSKYGTTIFDTQIHLDTEKLYKEREDLKPEDLKDITEDGGIYDDKLFEEYTKYNRSFTPRVVRIRDFYVDDKAIRQPFFERAEDCILIEFASLNKLKERRGDNKKYNIDGLIEANYTDKSGTTHNNCVMLKYYFNKITKDYIIIGGESKLIFHTKMKYMDGRLPFEMTQHYPDDTCLYGKGIPRKTRGPRGFKVNVMQTMLDKIYNSAYNNILLGGENVINDPIPMGGGINIREVDSATDFQQFQNNGDISGLQIVNDILASEIRQETGEDINAAFDTIDERLGQTEIREENKAIRLNAVNIARNISLDNILTATYNNIKQFAPILLRKSVYKKTKKGAKKLVKVIRPVISLPGIKVEKKNGKQTLEEVQDYGTFGRYELNPKYRLIDGVVKIITNSTYNKAGSILEKNKFDGYMANMIKTAQVYGGAEVAKKAPFEQTRQYMNQAYGYDMNGQYAAKTKKDKIRDKNVEKIEALKAKFAINQNPLDINQDPNASIDKQQIQPVNQIGAELPGGSPEGQGTQETM